MMSAPTVPVDPSAVPIAPRRHLHGWLATACGVLTGVIAMIGSWQPSIWSDEAATISASGRSIGDLWRMIGNIDLVHAFHYLLMHWWTALFGDSAVAIRLPSALFVAAAGACVYLIGLRLGGPRLALAAGLVFAVLPRVTWAGIEARPFALTVLLAAAATLVLLIALDTGKPPAWIGYAVLVVAGTLANLFVAILVAAHLVSLLASRRLDRSQWIGWLIAVIAAGAVSAVFVLKSFGQAGQLGERSFGLIDLAQNAGINQWFLGDTPTTTTGVSVSAMSFGDVGSWWLPASIVLAVAAWLLMVGLVVAAYRRGAGAARAWRPTIVWTVPWLVLPTVVIGGYSLAVSPIYSSRYLTFAAPAIALLLGAALAAITRKALRWSLVALLVVATVPIYVSQRQENAKNGTDWHALADYVGDHAHAGDGIYFVPRYDVPGVVVGQTSRGVSVAYPAPFAGLVDVTLARTPAEADNLAGQSRRLAASDAQLAAVNTLWVVQRKDYPQASAQDDAEVLGALGFRPAERWIGTIDEVLRFVRTT